MRPYWASPVGSICGLYLKETGRSLIRPLLSPAISRMSSLTYREDEATPSCPELLSRTGTPVTPAPLIPAMKVAVWVPPVPIRIVFDSAATPELPIQMLLFPVVRLLPALKPIAMLREPVVLLTSALLPVAVLLKPVVFWLSAANPVAVLPPLVVLLLSAAAP